MKTMNQQRAEWAEIAIQAFMNETGVDFEDAIADLLCDIRHLCDSTNQDFLELERKAFNHYMHEIDDE